MYIYILSYIKYIELLSSTILSTYSLVIWDDVLQSVEWTILAVAQQALLVMISPSIDSLCEHPQDIVHVYNSPIVIIIIMMKYFFFSFSVWQVNEAVMLMPKFCWFSKFYALKLNQRMMKRNRIYEIEK